MKQRPEDVSRLLELRLRERDVAGLEDLYEPAAVFADYDGSVAGWQSIRKAHQAFVDRGSKLMLHDPLVFEAGNIALVHWSWTVSEADGSEVSGASAEVLRRQGDGSWRFVIDNSDGSALIGRI